MCVCVKWEQLAEGMSTEGEVMDASGAPVTDELTGVHHGPQRDAIYEPEKTARCNARCAVPRRRPLQCRNPSQTSAQLHSTRSNTAEPAPAGGAAASFLFLRSGQVKAFHSSVCGKQEEKK